MQTRFTDIKNLKLVFNIKCPQCETQDLFKRNLYTLRPLLKMHSECPTCKLNYVPEPGFYFGSAYFSYFINVIWFGIGSLFLWLTYPEATVNTYVFFNSALMVLFLPYTFALSRSVWLNYIFHSHMKQQVEVVQEDIQSELLRLDRYGISVKDYEIGFLKNFLHYIHHESKCVYCGYEFEDFNTSGYKTCRNCVKEFTEKQFLEISLEQFKILELSK